MHAQGRRSGLTAAQGYSTPGTTRRRRAAVLPCMRLCVIRAACALAAAPLVAGGAVRVYVEVDGQVQAGGGDGGGHGEGAAANLRPPAAGGRGAVRGVADREGQP
ncbi:hypothetical protein CHLRE_10g426632v5 [Chlamydomonas reinhardtii]|uniref:Uncharacterized protein n=1 Tax=Chlamydomonas reinhardtii TaxID=3055 RepID=A0A2K3D9J8_CHLRE|nr:uncharacterized protein CHLRE_10g426632v5 [Chlamydomonas reinhardtii]PNW77205.1 hypothetical protein CHLRE_10g426632v5 [Chlamydomonas reinhardtii]